MQSKAICHVCLMLPGKPGLRILQSAIYRQYSLEGINTQCMHAKMQNNATANA
jgi:hypothetical protein